MRTTKDSRPDGWNPSRRIVQKPITQKGPWIMRNLHQNDTTGTTTEKRSSPQTITRSELRTRVGGFTGEVDDLYYELSEAASLLNELRDARLETIPSLDARIEARSRVHDQLSSRLLEVFRLAVGLREMLSGLEQLAEEP